MYLTYNVRLMAKLQIFSNKRMFESAGWRRQVVVLRDELSFMGSILVRLSNCR